MQVLNLTRCTTITRKTEISGSVFGKMKGLMFRKTLEEGKGMLFMFSREGRHSIWMLGMRFPIDILFIDSEKNVVGIHRDFQPMTRHPKSWKISKPEKKCKYVLEVSSGVIDTSSTRKGDQIEFVF